MERIRRNLLVLLLAGMVFLVLLGKRDVTTSHEGRVIQTARQMAASGWPWSAAPVSVPAVKLARVVEDDNRIRLVADPESGALAVNPWLVPVLNDELRLQKPPLPYWACAILFKLAGEWNEMLARIVPALLGALATFLVAGLARQVIGRRAIFPAAVAWVSGYFVPEEFRKSMADPYLTFFALSAVWGWIHAAARGGEAGKANGRGGRAAGLLVFYASVGLGLLAKGPPLLVHLAPPLVLYHVLFGRRLPGPIWAHLLGVALAAGMTVPWPMYVLSHVPNAAELWRFESVGELTDNLHGARPWYFYFPIALQLSLPWTAVWIAGFAAPFIVKREEGTEAPGRGGAKRVPLEYEPIGVQIVRAQPSLAGMVVRDRRMLWAVLWYAAVVLFFSLVHMKKPAYLLPLMPAQALIVAQGMVMLSAAARRFGKKSLASFVLAGQSLVALGACVVLIVILVRAGAVAAGGPTVVALTLVPLGLATMALRNVEQQRNWTWLTLLGTAQALAIVLFINYRLTAEHQRRSPRPAAQALAKLLAEDPAATVRAAELPEEASVYLPLDIHWNPQATTVYHLIDDRSGDGARDDQGYFERKYPGLRILKVERVEIAGTARPRWKLFKLSVQPAKILAGS